MRSFETIDSVRSLEPSQFMVRYENYGLLLYFASLRLGVPNFVNKKIEVQSTCRCIQKLIAYLQAPFLQTNLFTVHFNKGRYAY